MAKWRITNCKRNCPLCGQEAVCAAILRALGYQPAGLLYGGRKKREKRKEKREK